MEGQRESGAVSSFGLHRKARCPGARRTKIPLVLSVVDSGNEAPVRQHDPAPTSAALGGLRHPTASRTVSGNGPSPVSRSSFRPPSSPDASAVSNRPSSFAGAAAELAQAAVALRNAGGRATTRSADKTRLLTSPTRPTSACTRMADKRSTRSETFSGPATESPAPATTPRSRQRGKRSSHGLRE